MTSAVTVSAPVEAERTALLRWLQFQRDSVVAVVADLDPGLAETSVVPSGWTPAGLVWHLGDAEWFWAQSVLAGSTSPDPRPTPPGFLPVNALIKSSCCSIRRSRSGMEAAAKYTNCSDCRTSINDVTPP